MKQFSNYQTEIFNQVLEGEGNIIVNATAGSGKTTTLVEIAERLENDARYTNSTKMFCAFSKAIQEELATRLPKSMTVRTLHSHGMSTLRQATTKRLKVENWKYSNLISDVLKVTYGLTRDMDDNTEFLALSKAANDLLAFAQTSLVKPGDNESLANVAYKYDVSIEFDHMTRVFKIVSEVMVKGRQLIKDEGMISFTDMIWAPWALSLKPEQFDFIMVDESQDLNAAQLELISRSLKTQGRLVGVGDRSQSIFGFAGADSTSMDKIQKKFNAKEMPLSICYRCPSSHIELAKLVDPSIEARADAPKGKIVNIEEEDFADLVIKNDMIICRTNAPLVKACFQLIRKGIPATIKGRDIGRELAKLVEELFKGVPIFNETTLYDTLQKYLVKQRSMIVAKYPNNEERQEIVFSSVSDKVDVIHMFYEATEPNTVKELVDSINKLFSDEDGIVTLTSIHRAKGLEADRVFILKPELIPHPMAKSEMGREGERCVEFVALTRAKKELFFVGEYARLAQNMISD